MGIINLLPESVANQIAAGEVVQRPSSIVKELMENSVDAGATSVNVIVKDGGKSLIQVIDDGKGMSAQDLVMAFKRHATSKIKQTEDIFTLSTFGFRGEALPSISSVAEVELCSREHSAETGHLYRTNAAFQTDSTEECAMPAGTNIKVKELFYNIPARRKFLKADNTEFRSIIQEFIRVALTHNDVGFKLIHNGKDIYTLPAGGGLRQRIVKIFGKNIEKTLLPIKCDTSLIRINGYICSPEKGAKKRGDQYFFANSRYMRHPLFNKAVSDAYTGLIQPDTTPSYFIFFETAPDMIDVNIHPSKTEIKFLHEQDCFQILQACIKEVLGKYNIVPSIDFDMEGELEYTEPTKNRQDYIPRIKTKGNYNPFNYTGNSALSPQESSFYRTPGGSGTSSSGQQNAEGWEKLFEGMKESGEETAPELLPENETFVIRWAHSMGNYILASIPAGFAIIDKKAAHYRILYEKFSRQRDGHKEAKQSLLFPEILELNQEEETVISGLLPSLDKMGYECKLDQNTLFITTVPPWNTETPSVTIARLLDICMDGQEDIKKDINGDFFTKGLAKAAIMKSDGQLSDKECETVIYDLLCCDEPQITPDGKKTLTVIRPEDIGKLL